MPQLSCRFYKNKFPEIEEVVVVNVRSIAEMGAYVHLLEYNNIEGNVRSIHAGDLIVRRRVIATQIRSEIIINRVPFVPTICGRHDFAFGALATTYPLDQQAHQNRPQRVRRGDSCRQGQGLHRFVEAPRVARRHRALRREIRQR